MADVDRIGDAAGSGVLHLVNKVPDLMKTTPNLATVPEELSGLGFFFFSNFFFSFIVNKINILVTMILSQQYTQPCFNNNRLGNKKYTDMLSPTNILNIE